MSLEQEMIQPFESNQLRHVNDKKIISYGTSSYGYDVRCSTEFKIFTNINHNIVDPKDFDAQSFVEIDADECIIPPNSFALARTVEYFKIPRSTLVICLGKSTYARCGIIVNVTPLESLTPPLCLQKYMPTRVSLRCSFLSQMRSAKPPTKIGMANIKDRLASLYLRLNSYVRNFKTSHFCDHFSP